MFIRMKNYDDSEDLENSKEKEIEKKEFTLLQTGTVTKRVFQKRNILKHRVDAVGKELKHPLTRLSGLAQSVQKECQALQNEDAQLVKNMWNCFFEKIGRFLADFDKFITAPDQPNLGERTAILIQQGLDILDQVKFLNLETLFNQFLPKSIDDLTEQMEAILRKGYEEHIFPQIKRSLEQIQGGRLYLPEETFKKLSYLEQDAILLSMELALKLFEEVALIADKIELQFSLKEHALSSRIFPQQTGSSEKKLTEKKTQYNLIFLVEDDESSAMDEERLAMLSKKTPVLVKREEGLFVFGNLHGIWAIRKLEDRDKVITGLVDSEVKVMSNEAYVVLETCHAPLPLLLETLAQTYTTLAEKYKECMVLAGYSNRAAVGFYPYSRSIAVQRKKISEKLAKEIKNCQQQAVTKQPQVRMESVAAVDKLIEKRSKASPLSGKKERVEKVEKEGSSLTEFKKKLPTVLSLAENLTLEMAEKVHSEAMRAYETVVTYVETHEIPKEAITAPYKAWEEQTLMLAQLIAQKKRVDALSGASLVPEKKEESVIGLDELSMEIQALYGSTQGLMQALLGHPEDSKESKSLIVFGSIKKSIIEWGEELSAALDEDIYRSYVKIDFGERKAELSSHWLAQLGSGLADSKKTIELIEDLIKKSTQKKQEANATPASNMQARMKDTEKLLKELTALTKSFDELRKKFKDKDQKLVSLEVPTQFQGYVSAVPSCSLSDWEGFSEALIVGLRGKLEANPLFKRLEKFKKCKTPQAFFDMILKDPLDVSLQSTASAAVQRGIKLFDDYKDFTSDYLSPPGTMAKIRFAFRQRSAVVALATAVDILEEPLRLVYQEAGLKHAEELNDFFCALFLWIDELEMQFFLQEGFLANKLCPLMEVFNQQLAVLGYEFPPEKHYPYTVAILDQRKKILAHGEAHGESKRSDPEKTLRNKRLQQAKDKLVLEGKNSAEAIDKLKKEKADQKNKLIFTAIHQRIDELKSKSEFFSTIPSRKKTLLERLIKEKKEVKEEASPTFCLQRRLEELKDDPDYYLLFEGRTGECLRALRYHDATHADLIMELNSELDRLKDQVEGWVLFRKRLENKIKACEKLRDLLARPGYSLKEALVDLKAIDRLAYDLLLNYENPLLQKIRTIEGYIPEGLRPKKQILRSVSAIDEKKAAPVEVEVEVEVKKPTTTEDIIARIDREIRLFREQRYESVTFFARKTKTQLESSIKLLTTVRGNISSGQINFSAEEHDLLKSFVPGLLKELISHDQSAKRVTCLGSE